jgi:hypothetical protein
MLVTQTSAAPACPMQKAPATIAKVMPDAAFVMATSLTVVILSGEVMIGPDAAGWLITSLRCK